MARQLLITNGVLALPGGPERADILCDGHRIVAIGRDIEAPAAEVFDASALTLGPGFVDIHVHGGGGQAFFTKDIERIRAYAAWAPQNGVTSFLISTLGRDAEETTATLSALASAVGMEGGAEPLGFHLEGPFLNPARKGAFNEKMLRPAAQEEFSRYQEAAGGLIRQVTVAPEIPGALDVVAGVLATGGVAAMGHTDASTAEAKRGFEAGITHVTHLFNAMRPLHHRGGGPIVAALLEDGATCELICDGAHVAPEVLRLAYRALGPARTVVVTDNMHMAGTGDAQGRFGERAVTVSGASAVRDDGTIVGSVATMDQHFRNAQEFLGVNIPTAFRLCATNSARVAGSQRRKGLLDRGMDADIVMLDGALRVRATVCRGSLAYRC